MLIWLHLLLLSRVFSNYAYNNNDEQQEPQLFSYRVLEGVTEPLVINGMDSTIPLWKQMKLSADTMAVSRHIQVIYIFYTV